MISLFNFNPPIIAHRGASSFAPENTMSAFVKAVQLGINWIEFDVMLAAEGEPIIFHDELLYRTTRHHGKVTDYPYSYLHSLDAGAWFSPRFAGEKIPNLKQIMEFISNAKICANIEIKSSPGQEEEIVKCILTNLRILPDASIILFSSFSIKTLKMLRQYSATALLGLLMHEWIDEWENVCEELNCVSVIINHELMTIDNAQTIKNLGKKLLCYTVNDPIRALELYSFGVDAVFTDAPEKILPVVCNNGMYTQ